MEYKLLVRESELVAQQFKVKARASSMTELEQAIGTKAQAAGALPWFDSI